MPRPRLHRAVLCALFLVPSLAAGAAGPWHDDGPARVRLISPWAEAPAGGELWLGLEVALAPGWHSYWRNSGDAGYPPRVDLSGTPGLGEVELLFPVPERFDLPGDLVAFGYEESVVYPLRVRADFGSAAAVAVRGEVDYVVCASECIPFTSPLLLDQPLAAAPREDPAGAERLAAFRARLPGSLPSGGKVALRLIESRAGGGSFELAAEGLSAAPAELFFAPHDLVELGRPERRPAEGGAAFTVPFSWRDRSRTPQSLDLDWTLALPPGGVEGASTIPLAMVATSPAAGEDSSARRATRWPWIGLAAVVLLGLVWALWPRSADRRAA
jgi:DsbC/DsbD-like thiol-disulfide interchange protein